MHDVALILLPAAFAAVVAIAGTVAVERLGGRLGSVLHTVPTTIVPASLGMWAGSPSHTAFVAGMAAVPLGMLVDAGFLWMWRALPPRLPATSLGARLAVMVASSLGVWFGGAWVLVTGLAAARAAGHSGVLVGLIGLLTLGAVGVLSCISAPPAPKGSRRPTLLALAGRGVLAAAAIAVCVAIARYGDPVAAGLASAFPAMLLTTMVSLWLAQGEAVPIGAVGPLILGTTSVGAYALIAIWALPTLGPWLGTPVSWTGAVLCTSVPAGLWLTRGSR